MALPREQLLYKPLLQLNGPPLTLLPLPLLNAQLLPLLVPGAALFPSVLPPGLLLIQRPLLARLPHPLLEIPLVLERPLCLNRPPPGQELL